MYGLPSTVTVDQPLPKNAFYKRLSLNVALKEDFVRLVDELRVIASVKETSCGIPASDDIEEISVLRIALKTDEVPRRVLEAVAAQIPRKMLFVCVRGDEACLAVKRGGLHVGSWQEERSLVICLGGVTLASVWDGLCASAIFGDVDGSSVDERIERSKRMSELEAEVAQLKRKHGREVQPARRNALFKQLRAAKAELAALKGE